MGYSEANGHMKEVRAAGGCVSVEFESRYFVKGAER